MKTRSMRTAVPCSCSPAWCLARVARTTTRTTTKTTGMTTDSKEHLWRNTAPRWTTTTERTRITSSHRHSCVSSPFVHAYTGSSRLGTVCGRLHRHVARLSSTQVYFTSEFWLNAACAEQAVTSLSYCRTLQTLVDIF